MESPLQTERNGNINITVCAAEKYTNPLEDVETQTLRIHVLQEQAQSTSGLGYPKMLASDVMFARGKLSRNKAAGGLSSVVYEMLLELPHFLLQIIIHLLIERYCTPTTQEIGGPSDFSFLESWSCIVVCFLRKFLNPKPFPTLEAFACWIVYQNGTWGR